MSDKHSQIILQVERAASDLRRGQSVIISGIKGKNIRVAAGEYKKGKDVITDSNHPAVKLMKIAGLLPDAVIEKDAAGSSDNLLEVTAQAIADYPLALASGIEKISEARVPLKDAGETTIIAFRPRFGHQEHLAIVVGEPQKQAAPYVRIHSSCITGDVLGSLRCDCGNQLHKALMIIGKQKNGIILYLSQEGRGISIANKLRAYELQDEGMDTVEANEALGFLPDERDFAVAAEMLRSIGLHKVTLITNNPEKIKALARYGIEVVRREPVVTETNMHNRRYLKTKASKLGHHLKD